MHVFGEINNSSTLVEQKLVNYTHNFTTSSEGIESVKVVSGSSIYSGSYWDSLNVLFYTSGSSVYSDESNKFAKPSSNLSTQPTFGTQYLHKFYGYPSSLIIQISQQYYGTTEFWWFIASVNNLSTNNIEAGTQLRVPVSTESAKLK